MRFLKSVEVHTIFPLFEGALETGKITKSALRNWVVSLLILCPHPPQLGPSHRIDLI